MSFGLVLVGVGLVMFRALDAATSYAYILAAVIPLVSGMALAMSPMTAAIMSAVPPRRRRRLGDERRHPRWVRRWASP
ncbi:MAG: hypothetical protein R2690_11480 [Acidimicrobiales bacterium]